MPGDTDKESVTTEFYNGVLPKEVASIQERRGKATPCCYEKLAKPTLPDSTHDGDAGVRQKAKQCRESHLLRPFGLALSGGGIRSATFNLGVLQGLAERGLLPYLDYLSTVSGGGYIGSWFHGVVWRAGGQPSTAADCLSPLKHAVPGIPDDDHISFLRKYSNYLAPKPGVFSPDTWVIGSIWLRNVLLNQLILVPAIALLVLAGLAAGFLQQQPAPSWWSPVYPVVLAGSVLLATVLWMSSHLSSIAYRSLHSADEIKAKEKQGQTADEPDRGPYFPILVFFSCMIITCCGAGIGNLSLRFLALGLLLLFGLFQESGGFRRCYCEQHKHGRSPGIIALLHLIWMPALSAGTSWLLIWQTWRWMAGAQNTWMILTFAPPLACASVMAGVSLLIGLMGADYPDAAREWLASIGSNLSMICAAWIVFFSLTIFGPWALSWVLVFYSRTGFAAILTWATTTAAGVLAGRSSSTNGANQPGNPVFAFLIKITPTVFVLGYLLMISFGVHALVRNLDGWETEHAASPAANGTEVNLTLSTGSTGLGLQVKASRFPKLNWFENNLRDLSDWHAYFQALDSNGERWTFLALLIALVSTITFIASSRFNINEFSIHHFYKNRLVRCYMGASNSHDRKPNARTGFDAQDDFPLANLQSANNYFGPYPIMNTALNLNAGSELATQERKASSFFFTPLFSGYEPGYSKKDKREKMGQNSPEFQLDGYRGTTGYSTASGPSIGTAMAISGAAASPNSGYHTSAPMAFLLTVFNLRLGWWVGNPRFSDASCRPGPVFALKYLFMELTAQTTARTKFVNLSDGGHFDNLGLYELVRRRCRYIVVGDAEEDSQFTFESLGGAIRKCRADFGVEIDINPDPIRAGPDGFSSSHCVVGKIIYPELEQGWAADLHDHGLRFPKPKERAQGWLLYLKSSVTGNEPADIAQYRSAHKGFPHEPTLDEFFSESQFESYRRLGLHAVRETLADIDLEITHANADLCNLFQGLTRKWYAPIKVTAEEGARLTDKYSALMKRLAEDAQLAQDFRPLLPGQLLTTASKAPLSLASLEFGTELLQLIEDVVNLYGFEQDENFTNPGIEGWVQVFHRWVTFERFFVDVWTPAKDDYQHGFRTFIDKVKDLKTRPLPPPSI